MIIFDLLMTIFEDFLISYFLISFFVKEKKLSRSIILTFICVFETFVLNNYFRNNEFLFLTLVFTWAGALCLLEEKVSLFFLTIPCLLMGLLLISNISSFYLFSFLFNVKINDISNNISLLFFSIIFSRIIFSILSYWLYKKLYSLKGKKKIYEFSQHKSFIILMICLFSIVTTIGESIVYGIFNYKIYLLLILEFVLMCISSVILFVDMQIDYKKKLDMQSEMMQLEYSRKMYFETSKISYQFSKEKHDLYYLLKKIENAVVNNDQREIVDMVQYAVKKINKMNMSYTSLNAIFDYMVTQKIKNLKLFNYDVVYIANISESEILADKALVKNLEHYIDCLTFKSHKKTENHVEIKVLKKKEYIIFEVNIDQRLELSESIFDFENKSKQIIQEKLQINDDCTYIKVLIK